MRLGLLLMEFVKMPNGHIFRGKDRLVKIVTSAHKRQLRAEYAIEENNMLLLRHPYLTETESHGHSKELGKNEKLKRLLVGLGQSKFKPHVRYEDRLMHLRVNDCWD